MCNWSDGIYNDGYEAGQLAGRLAGQLAGHRAGQLAGIQLTQHDNVFRMLADNLPLAKIIQYTGLTEQEILDIRDKSNTPKD